jgi:putative nucleotidyltransferase with HDIG domain
MLAENGVPANIVAHSVQVARIAVELAQAMASRGLQVNVAMVEAGALLHDISKHEGFGKNPSVPHGLAGAQRLADMGLHDIAAIVECHVMESVHELNTWEKKLVFYADKRVNHDQPVTFDQRMEYLLRTYPRQAATFHRVAGAIRELEAQIFRAAGRATGD